MVLNTIFVPIQPLSIHLLLWNLFPGLWLLCSYLLFPFGCPRRHVKLGMGKPELFITSHYLVFLQFLPSQVIICSSGQKLRKLILLTLLFLSLPNLHSIFLQKYDLGYDSSSVIVLTLGGPPSFLSWTTAEATCFYPSTQSVLHIAAAAISQKLLSLIGQAMTVLALKTH